MFRGLQEGAPLLFPILPAEASLSKKPRRSKRKSCYPSDLTDDQWALIEPLVPKPCGRGRPPAHPSREVVNAILYVVSTGCPWRYMPADLPPRGTAYHWFHKWMEDGTWNSIHDALVVAMRRRANRPDPPTAAIIDSQSVKADEKGGPANRATMEARR